MTSQSGTGEHQLIEGDNLVVSVNSVLAGPLHLPKVNIYCCTFPVFMTAVQHFSQTTYVFPDHCSPSLPTVHLTFIFRPPYVSLGGDGDLKVSSF